VVKPRVMPVLKSAFQNGFEYVIVCDGDPGTHPSAALPYSGS